MLLSDWVICFYCLKEKREVYRLSWCLLKIDQKVLKYVKIAWCLSFWVRDRSKGLMRWLGWVKLQRVKKGYYENEVLVCSWLKALPYKSIIICENLFKPLLLIHACVLLILIFISIFAKACKALWPNGQDMRL